ncbi:TetR/AcrR family transcriptional regulator [Micromonospora musae]|uniref:TetR/AcrR family transcriptional regulator n=1 Tax=Micromonospora musae TaxID=1894970 RepID=A0A3A9YD01_9ACTN|nr:MULTISPECIES: TetR/AcrR family transcriptional regulator [Micromonospora]RKN13209.1 TetR/AcrR family transcriptional regulator [Micromonospora musae]RKN29687.1 TetR/AcrR family transcriptional regulator [Micromonospora musae]TYB95410.1 helix-turn-helix transcriptional regulator [Micromonospora sp. WP24]
MRADAARNLDLVLRTGARLLAEDPATSMSTIASAAGVDRRTVYRRFATREALLSAVFMAKLDNVDLVFEQARLDEAPVQVALHRYVEGIVPVSRQWPVDMHRMMRGDPTAYARAREQSRRLDRFVERAVDEGLFRDDLPVGWLRALLDQVVSTAAHQFTDLAPPEAADRVVESLLNGIGSH